MAPVTGPLRYGVQLSAQEEYVQLVEQAKALLSHAHNKSSLEEIHLRLHHDVSKKPTPQLVAAARVLVTDHDHAVGRLNRPGRW